MVKNLSDQRNQNIEKKLKAAIDDIYDQKIIQKKQEQNKVVREKWIKKEIQESEDKLAKKTKKELIKKKGKPKSKPTLILIK
ncbi:MAG: hypothetical protein JWM09_1283 [Francisellaceae bacterium]|nr:hypothetical protein [Francisellaceae bacterium]